MKNYLIFPFLVPRIVALFADWPKYLFNYVLRRKVRTVYHLRDGTSVLDATGTLAGTLAVVFVRREYGTLPKCKTVVDIGANLGSFAIFAARSLRNQEARILCFEPVESNFETLLHNIRSNSLEGDVVAFKIAVAGKGSKRSIAISESPLNSIALVDHTSRVEMVDCTTLPEIMDRNGLSSIDLLKINCEGAEYEILEECPEEYLKRIHRIRLEYHNLDDSMRNGASLKKWLECAGFQITRFSNDRGKSGFIWADRK